MGRFINNFRLEGDRVIWIIIFLLSIISLLVVYSSTGTLAYKVKGGNTSYFFIKQLVLLLGCYFIIWVTHKIPYKHYSSWANMGLLIAIGMLLLAKIVGVNLNQASRWITIPVIGFNFQPRNWQNLRSYYLYQEYYQSFKPIRNVKKKHFEDYSLNRCRLWNHFS